MLKNLLTKKLYQFIIIIYALVTLQIIDYNAYSMEFGVYNGVTTSCLYSSVPNEKLETSIIEVGFQKCIVTVPAVHQDPVNQLLCIEAPKCGYDNVTQTYFLVRGEKSYYSVKKDRWRLGPTAGDRQYDSLLDCRSNKGFTALNTITGSVYSDLNNCMQADIASRTNDIPVTDVDTSSICYNVPKVGGKRAIALYNDNIGGRGPFNETCQCFTQQGEGSYSGRKVGIFFKSETNSITTYKGIADAQIGIGSSDGQKAQWYLAASKCLAENSVKYFNSRAGGCFDTSSACQRSMCEERDEGSYFVDGVKKSNNEVKTLQDSCNSDPICLRNLNISVCSCSQAFNPAFDPLYCSVNPSSTTCASACKLVKSDFRALNPIKISSPLALINVVVNFLFWLAVAIFVINILSASLDYIKGGDQPDKLKEASDRITGTIFGFVFLLVASGVINFIISRIKEFGL
jgi:hypothetical protein